MGCDERYEAWQKLRAEVEEERRRLRAERGGMALPPWPLPMQPHPHWQPGDPMDVRPPAAPGSPNAIAEAEAKREKKR